MSLVSIVIATYNCEGLLRSTLNSIRMGGWGDVEVIIMDGGSKDKTLEPVDDFNDLNLDVTSGPDGGQYDAIKKGMDKARGEILCWINAGDIFIPGAVASAVRAFEKYPEMQWLTGRQCVAEGDSVRKISESLVRVSDLEIRLGLCAGKMAGHLQQEGMFWRRSLWEESGGLDLEFKLAGDFELWTRFAELTPLYRAKIPLAAFSYHGTNRSISEGGKYRAEVEKAIAGLSPGKQRARKLLAWLPLYWRVTRRLPIIRDFLGFSYCVLKPLHIHLLVFEREGSHFEPVVKMDRPWIK